MQLSFRTLDGAAIVSVAGIVDSRSAGQLYDALVACIDNGTAKLVVDLSGVHIMTHAGARGLVVAAKLMQTVGGEPAADKEVQERPELAIPLQRLDRVKQQDSPARLFQLMQDDDRKEPAKKERDW